MVDLRTALYYASQKFLKLGISSSRLDARLLLAFLLDKSTSYILAHLDTYLNPDEYQKFLQLVARRSKLEPIAYIIGEKEFYGHNFFIDKNVLIPRPSTELLIDVLLKEYSTSTNDNLSILDLGTGSGCIIITLLHAFTQARGVGIDICDKALLVALKNAKSHNVNNRLKLIQSDWFKNINIVNSVEFSYEERRSNFDSNMLVTSDNLGELESIEYIKKYDIIVSNPPYISENEMGLMAQETLLYEPKHALFACNNGLRAYENIAISAKNYLKEDGKLVIEIGFNQQEDITDLFLTQGYKLIDKFQDLAGHNRAIMFKK